MVRHSLQGEQNENITLSAGLPSSSVIYRSLYTVWLCFCCFALEIGGLCTKTALLPIWFTQYRCKYPCIKADKSKRPVIVICLQNILDIACSKSTHHSVNVRWRGCVPNNTSGTYYTTKSTSNGDLLIFTYYLVWQYAVWDTARDQHYLMFQGIFDNLSIVNVNVS